MQNSVIMPAWLIEQIEKEEAMKHCEPQRVFIDAPDDYDNKRQRIIDEETDTQQRE